MFIAARVCRLEKGKCGRGKNHATLAAVGWVLTQGVLEYSEQHSGFQAVIVLEWKAHTKGTDGLETRVPSLRPRDARGETLHGIGAPAGFFLGASAAALGDSFFGACERRFWAKFRPLLLLP